MSDRDEDKTDATSVYEDIMRGCLERQEIRKGDWFDGEMLYCGKCKEPRRAYETIDGKKVLVPVMCRCEETQAALEKAEDEKRKRDDRYRVAVSLSDMPIRFLDATFAKWRPKTNEKIKSECESFVDRFEDFCFDLHIGLLFYGGPGNGKTYAACAIGNALMKRGFSVLFISVSDYVSKALDRDFEENALSRAKSADMVILDDMGAERDTSFGAEKVYNLVNGLYEDRKCVVATTNYTMKELRDNSRTLSRLLEMTHPVQFLSSSVRERISSERFDKIDALLNAPSKPSE